MKLPRILSNPLYLLPLTILVGVLVLGLSIQDAWNTATSGKMFTHDAMAETKDAPPASDAKPAAPAQDAGTAKPADTPTLSAPSAPIDDDTSPAEMDVLKQLSDRREQLDKRGKDLDTREAVIKVAEQRVDQKIKDMETLRTQLQSMMTQISGAQNTQVENLVKIYETMKPEEAAHIFETLDMPVLLSVIRQMKPAHTAPIMAKMAPEKAKEVTVALTKQDQLPQIK